MQIFLDDGDYCAFLGMLAAMTEKFDIECWNYTVMPNHYHLTIRPLKPNLSSALQELNGEYGRWWNHRHRRVGHVFQGRFKDQIVDRDAYLMALYRYVAMNPVRSGLVDRPERWHWSSYAATIGLAPAPAFLTLQPVVDLFGCGNIEIARERFARFVTSRPDDFVDTVIRSSARVLGSQAKSELAELGTRGQTQV